MRKSAHEGARRKSSVVRLRASFGAFVFKLKAHLRYIRICGVVLCWQSFLKRKVAWRNLSAVLLKKSGVSEWVAHKVL
jgi:hypothetical protein